MSYSLPGSVNFAFQRLCLIVDGCANVIHSVPYNILCNNDDNYHVDEWNYIHIGKNICYYMLFALSCPYICATMWLIGVLQKKCGRLNKRIRYTQTSFQHYQNSDRRTDVVIQACHNVRSEILLVFFFTTFFDFTSSTDDWDVTASPKIKRHSGYGIRNKCQIIFWLHK